MTAPKTGKKPALKKEKPAPSATVAGVVASSVTYSPEVCEAICALIAEGKSLRSICAGSDMPSMATVMRWLADEDKPAFREQYARAREAQADRMAEDILAIADDGLNDTYTDEEGSVRTNQDVIARSRLRVDARKWLASKMAPKKYGDKLGLGGADGFDPVGFVSKEMTDAERAVRLSRLLAGNPAALSALLGKSVA